MSAVRFLARPLLGSSFIVAGAGKLKNADDTAEQLSPVLRRAADALRPQRVHVRVVFVDDLPRSTIEKLARSRLRARAIELVKGTAHEHR